MSFLIVVNGQPHTFAGLAEPVSLTQVVAALEVNADRIAVEHNGSIVQRTAWPATEVSRGDRLEVVHFVGGGSEGALLGGRETDYT